MLCSGLLAVAIRSAPEGASTLALGYGLFASVCVTYFVFGLGWGAVAWVYPSEIFPMHIKEKALATSVLSQWLANFTTNYVSIWLFRLLSAQGLFFFYCSSGALACTLIYSLVPEVKGLSLEEVGTVFGEKALLAEKIGS